MTGTGEALAIIIFFHGATQMRTDQADSDDALVCMLDGGRDVQAEDLDTSRIFVFGPQVKFGGRTGIRLETEETEQTAQAKQPAQAEEGVSEEFEEIAARREFTHSFFSNL